MTAIVSTSGCLHSELVCLLFLQTHRETDRFFEVSGVQVSQSTSGQFHFRLIPINVDVVCEQHITHISLLLSREVVLHV